MNKLAQLAALLVCAAVASTAVHAQKRRTKYLPLVPVQVKPLAPADIDDLARLLMLEDTRQFDEAALGRILKSAHPEVRRRAVVAIGRIADTRGGALLESMRADPDTQVAATVVFATGQLKDPTTVRWLAETLSSRTTPASAREAAIALGKIQVPESRAALARYLAEAPTDSALRPIVGEALLSIGRFPVREDLAPIVRWITSPDVNVRWRATWALFRPRDPAAIPHLLRLSKDLSPEVRSWAVRGLVQAPPAPAAAGTTPAAPSEATPPQPVPALDTAPLAARLRDGVKDADRHVRTEALRALAQHDDDASFGVVLAALDSTDTWLSISAAEAMTRFKSRADVVVPRLVAATASGKPLALRVTALAPLAALSPEAALDAAAALARESSIVAQSAARQALGRLGEAGKARLETLVADGVLAAPAATRPAPTPAPARAEAEYRKLVERWIVPDYKNAPRPRAIWETPRGTVELELFPGDAPLGVEYFVRMVESGAIVGTEFGRVVPDFVAQQRAIRDDTVLRDEVNRRGLTRANLSWASAGLDTGRPGYTLAVTPQPHNEGNFTALGRVVVGMDVVERLELGDKVTAARMVTASRMGNGK